MKKTILLILSLVLILAPTSNIFATNTVSGIVLDGEEVSLDVKPIIKYGRTLVPARALLESLGFDIIWDGQTKNVIAKKGSDQLVLAIDQPWENYYNGVRVGTSTSAKIVNGRTLVPVRLSAELLGFDVDWNSSTRKVIINTNEEKSNLSLKGAHDLLADVVINRDRESLLYFPLDSGISHDKDIREQYYIFISIEDYGYGLEVNGGNYLIDRNTGEMYTFTGNFS